MRWNVGLVCALLVGCAEPYEEGALPASPTDGVEEPPIETETETETDPGLQACNAAHTWEFVPDDAPFDDAFTESGGRTTACVEPGVQWEGSRVQLVREPVEPHRVWCALVNEATSLEPVQDCDACDFAFDVGFGPAEAMGAFCDEVGLDPAAADLPVIGMGVVDTEFPALMIRELSGWQAMAPPVHEVGMTVVDRADAVEVDFWQFGDVVPSG